MGNPLDFILTPGQAHDLEGADALLPDMAAETLLADKAFDADERVIEPLLARGKSFVIPPKSNRKVQRDFDKDAYKARHLIENFFCKLKQYRAIATRYDKTARNFLAAIHLAAAIIWRGLYRFWPLMSAPVTCCRYEGLAKCGDVLGLEQRMMLSRYLEDLDVRTSASPRSIIASG